MEASDYAQALSDGATEASQTVSTLGWVVALAVSVAAAAWAAWLFRDWLAAAVNVGLARAGDAPSRMPVTARLLIRRGAVRRPLALGLASLTLAAGLTAGVLQLEGGRRRRRFWCLTPAEVERSLRGWAGVGPPADAGDDIRAWAARHDPTDPYGRAVAAIAAQMLAEVQSGRPRPYIASPAAYDAGVTPRTHGARRAAIVRG